MDDDRWKKFLDAVKAGATVYAGETVHQAIVNRCGPLAAGVKLCKLLDPMDAVAIDESEFDKFGSMPVQEFETMGAEKEGGR